jgi:hypothetical protein
VLDQALALSPEDRARLINQLAAQGWDLSNDPSAQTTDKNPDAVEYLTPQHPNADWKSPMEWLRMNHGRYREQWVGLMVGAWSRMDRKLLRFLPLLALKEFIFITFILEKSQENGT